MSIRRAFCSPKSIRHSGARVSANPESRDSGFDAIGPRSARTRWHCPGMTTRQKKPAVICDGRPLFGLQQFAAAVTPRYAYRTLMDEGAVETPLADDLGGHPAHAGAGQADGTRS